MFTRSKVLKCEIKRIIIEEELYTEANYPFTIKPIFSTFGSIIQLSTQGPLITVVPNDRIRDLLGFNKIIKYEENNLSLNPVDILSFDNIFFECVIVQGMIFQGKRSAIIHNCTMDVNSGYQYIEKIGSGVQWYLRESKDILSSVCFKLRNEKNQLVPFNGQSITFRLSIKEI